MTVAICCNPNSSLSRLAEYAVTPVVGPEVLSGSTRMKAGTAQKLVLNMFSTAIMIRLGHVYSNWMINVQMNNAKLKARGRRILRKQPACLGPIAGVLWKRRRSGSSAGHAPGKNRSRTRSKLLTANKGNVRQALHDMARS